MKIADFLIEAAPPKTGELFKIEQVQKFDDSLLSIAHHLKTDTGDVLVGVNNKDVTLVGTRQRLSKLARSLDIRNFNDYIVPAPEFKVTNMTITGMIKRHDGSFSDRDGAGIWGTYLKKYLAVINDHFKRDWILFLYVGKNKNGINAMDVAVIHPEMTTPATEIDNAIVRSNNQWGTKEIKLKVVRGNGPQLKINQNPDYQFLMGNFEDVTTHKQMLNGSPRVFDLGFKRGGQSPDQHNWTIWIYNNGYARINRGHWHQSGRNEFKDTSIIVSPTGSTPEDKYQNAWHGAAEWAKRFLKRKDDIK